MDLVSKLKATEETLLTALAGVSELNSTENGATVSDLRKEIRGALTNQQELLLGVKKLVALEQAIAEFALQVDAVATRLPEEVKMALNSELGDMWSKVTMVLQAPLAEGQDN